VNVLHTTKVQGIGGAEQHLLALLPALRAQGVDARFLSLDGGLDADRFHRALDERDVPYERVRCGLDVSPRLASAVARAVRRVAPDIVHTHMVHADVYGSLAARLARRPFVSTRHNDDRYLLGPFRHVDRTLMRGVARVVAISDAVKRFHIEAGLAPEKLVTIHYGLDEPPRSPSEVTPAELGVPADAPLLLAIGRLIEQKDHTTLLRAFARIRETTPDAQLAILGWGRLESDLHRLSAELGLTGSVHIPGRVEPRDWLARADVFVHTSRWEGFGIVLLEAMLAGLPVVATRVSAVPEIVVDEETGLLTEPGDAAGIAAAVGALIAAPDRRNTFGEAGRARARQEFSVARMAERTVAVYERAASNG
jgi:glycosyltransferase involved in cell wall biosynthesis